VIAAYFTIYKLRQKLHGKDEDEGLTAFEMMGLWGEMRAYPFAAIPQERFNNAFNRMKSDEERKRKSASNRMSTAMTATQASPWVPLAPKNFAGRILCLGFHPTDQNIIWA